MLERERLTASVSFYEDRIIPVYDRNINDKRTICDWKFKVSLCS